MTFDCIQMPANDRRFFVMYNEGEPAPTEFWDGAHAWLDDDANIAAFYHELRQVDIAGFNPFKPPMTRGSSG